MKVLVQQVYASMGFLAEDFSKDAEDDRDFIENICIPSAQRYAEVNGYDYHLETSVPDIIHKLAKQKVRVDGHTIHVNMRMTYIKYLMLEKYKEYDYILLLDVDTIVTESTPPLPLSEGVTTGPIDWPVVSDLFYKEKSNRIVYANAGFYLFDASSAKVMYEFVKKKINYYISEMIYDYKDEKELAQMMNENLNIPHNELQHQWNHWGSLFSGEGGYVPPCHIYHFLGKRKAFRFNKRVEEGWLDDKGNHIDNQ